MTIFLDGENVKPFKTLSDLQLEGKTVTLVMNGLLVIPVTHHLKQNEFLDGIILGNL